MKCINYVLGCLAVACSLLIGCRPAEPPSATRESGRPATKDKPVATPAPPAAAAPLFSLEQMAAARKMAQDMGVVIKEDAAGNVILLDTAAKRSWVDDYQLQEMLVFPQLQSLTVEGPSISHLVAPQIAKLTTLTTLAMRNTLITNEGVAEFQGLKALKVIDLRLSPLLDDTALESLAIMPQLRAVRLLGVNVSDDGVSALLELPQLNELDLRNCRGVTRVGIERLAGKPSLRTLKIGGASIDDEVLGIVGKMNQLATLSLYNCPITDDGVARLASLPLQELTIYQCTSISDEGLRVLGSLAELQRLTLRDVQAHGASLALLPHPEKLVDLDMAQSSITDAEAANLARFSHLASLTLSETSVTDAAVDVLSQLTSLKTLTIAQTHLSQAGISRLAAALPQCKIRTL
ncbi:MAG: hypothetical protein ACYC4U_17310 [Pirellulaceae bacterium]